MPIFPTYGGVSTSIATQATPDLPSDPAIKQLAQVGQATENLGNNLTHLMQRRQAIDDEATATQRLMQADKDLQDLNETFTKPDIGYNAKAEFSKTVDQKRSDWFKGLSPGATKVLQTRLAPKLMEYQRHAYKVEHQNHADAYEVTGDAVVRDFTELQSRRTGPADGTETREMTDLKDYFRKGMEAGYYTREQADKKVQAALQAGATSRVLRAVTSDDPLVVQDAANVFKLEANKPIFMADAAPAGLLKKGNINLADRPVVKNPDGTKSTVRSMSFQDDNGHEILVPTISDDGRVMSPEEAIKQYYDTGKMLGAFATPGEATAYAETLHRQQESLYNGEGPKGGSTYLKHIPPAKRAELQRQVEARGEHLLSMERERKNQERLETKRMTEELSDATVTMAEMKIRNPDKYGTLTHEWLDQAAEEGLIKGKDLDLWRTRLETVQRSGTAQTGGYGDATTIGRLNRDAAMATTPEEAKVVLDDLKQAIIDGRVPAGGPGDIGTQLLDKLNAKAKHEEQDYGKRQEATDAKRRVTEALRVTGPFAQGPLKQAENAAVESMFRLIDEDAKAGYPKGAMQVLDENLDLHKARVGVPAKIDVTTRRKLLGLPLTKDPKAAAESIDVMQSDLTKQLDAVPPGQEGNAQRRTILNKARELMRLQKLETAIEEFARTSGQSRGMAQPSSGSSSSGPSMGPKGR